MKKQTTPMRAKRANLIIMSVRDCFVTAFLANSVFPHSL